MRRISLNEYLNAKNIWTKRLLHLEHFNVHRDIEILEYERDIIGLNPLNPTNLIVWRFK